jgi:hypothetical protein
MISTKDGNNYTRKALKKYVEILIRQIIVQGHNPHAVNDIYENVWHPQLSLSKSYKRMVVVPPWEVQEQCHKISKFRMKAGQKEIEIEAVIMKWCGDHYVTPLKVVFTNKPVVLFFDDDAAFVMAKLAMFDFTRDFVKRCWDAV